MISTTHDLIKKFLEEHKVKKVLDVGSLDVNGSLKEDFKDYEYTGVDMREGKNVDIVLNAHDLSKKFGKQFDLVVCFDTFEHDDAFWISIKEMKKVLKKNGWLIIGTPSIHHPIHRHPRDYWRFTKDSFEDVFFKDMEDVWVEEQVYGDQGESNPDQVMGYGRKP